VMVRRMACPGVQEPSDARHRVSSGVSLLVYIRRDTV
jgi:hypothetical protein